MLESIKKWNLGGVELRYNPADHRGLVFVDLSDLSIIGSDSRVKRWPVGAPKRAASEARHSGVSKK